MTYDLGGHFSALCGRSLWSFGYLFGLSNLCLSIGLMSAAVALVVVC